MELMSDPAFELIQLAVDGELTPSQRAELDTILAGSPDARRSLESMTELARTLSVL